ncbi:MAG: lipopolysaccharide biosynthesis protein [Nitrosomonadales bacterium]|nr:MAG: lipopolysaccharide biosynthesis protein [Nitrosomonadales bacterium]
MSLGQSIRHGAVWLFIGNTSSQILTFLFGIVLARLLAPSDFGMLVTISIFTGIAGFIAGGGMGQALVHAKEVTKQDYDVVFTLQIIIGCLIYAFFFFAAPWFAKWYSTPLYADLLRISALSFIFRPFINLPGSILHREMQFKAKTIAGFASLLLSSAISIAMAYAGYGVWSLILGGMASAVASAFILALLAKWRPGFSLDFRRGRNIARYGMLVAIGDFIVYLRSQASNFILSKTLGPLGLGLYNKANSLTLIPHGQITGAVYQVTFRALAKEQDDLNLSQYLYLRSITLVSIYTWPLLLALAWLALPLIRFVYGDKWVGTALPMAWLAAIGPFIMLEILAGSVLAARNWLDREIPVQITQLIVVSLGVIAGLPYGLLGVAIGASLANIYGAFHMTWLASKCLSMRMRRIAISMGVPLLLNLGVLLLWITLDALFKPQECCGDFIYLLVMLGSGGLLYALLFFFAPIPNIDSEKQRWLNLVRKPFAMMRKS